MTQTRHRIPGATVLSIAAVIALGFGVRLLLGLRTPLDADEATFGLAALHITQGTGVLMEPNGQYLGALDAYVAAPFVAVLGTSLVAVRAALAVVGAIYVLCMYLLGRVLFRGHRAGLLTALVAAVFPLFAAYWSVKLRGGYTELPLLEAASLALAGRIGWALPHRARWWGALGLIAGVALWSDLLFLGVLAPITVGLLLRAGRIGAGVAARGAVLALAGGIVGFLPWLIFNVPNGLYSLHAIPKNYVGFGTGLANLLGDHLPIFTGGSSSCTQPVIPAAVSDAALGVLAVALLWMRRHTLRNVLSGHWAGFEPLDLTLVIFPVTFVMLILSRVNYDPCAPRYLMPMAVPLVAGVTAVLLTRMPWRGVAAASAVGWLMISVVAAAGPLPDLRTTTASGATIPSDLGPGLAMIEAHHPGALWAQYWLSRPLSYYSHDTLAIGEYGGFVGFLQRQQEVQTAIDPSWVFVDGDPEIGDFTRACRARGTTYQMYTTGGLVLFTALSATLEPENVFTGPDALTTKT